MEVTNALGRRKTAVARIYLQKGKGTITINKRDIKEYFPTETLQYAAKQPLLISKNENNYDIVVNVKGGGIAGQAEAVSLAIARAIVKLDPEAKPALKAEELMTRDPRMVERKKPGQKKARKKFQFSKR
jgi:small subunit ribosomal protein S9